MTTITLFPSCSLFSIENLAFSLSHYIKLHVLWETIQKVMDKVDWKVIQVSHTESHSKSQSENHLERNFDNYLEIHSESHVNISHLVCELNESEN